MLESLPIVAVALCAGFQDITELPILSSLFERKDKPRVEPPKQEDAGVGFEQAGRRELALLPNDRARLRYALGRSTTAGADTSQLGKLTPRDHYVLAEVRRRFPQIDAEIVDIATCRTRGHDDTRLEFERVLETSGAAREVEAAAAWLDRLIEINRQQVLIRCMVVSHTEDGPGSGAVVVSALERASFEQASLETSATGEVITAPNLVVTGGVSTHVAVLDQIAYVSDFEIEAAHAAMIANPVIDVIQSGIILEVTPVIDAASGTLLLDTELKIATLKRPIPEVTTSLGKQLSPVTIQLPEVYQSSWRSSELSIAPGEHGIRVADIPYVDWDEDGELLHRRISIFLRAELAGEATASPTEPLGVVLGFDPDTRKAFVRLSDGEVREVQAKSIRIEREGRVIGVGVAEEITGSILVVRLTEGEARKGDRAR